MQLTQETIDLARAALGNPIPTDEIQRAFTQPGTATTGLIAYSLEAPSKKLYPLITPLRNKIPRQADGYGIQSNWQVVSGININNLDIGVSERNRGGVIAQTTSRYYAAFAECGLENYVTWKAESASKNYEDLKALAQVQLLQSVMIQEEFLDLGGMSTWGMGTTPTPVVTDGGLAVPNAVLLASTAYYVGCVALNLKGYQQVAGWNMGITGQAMNLATSLVQTIARTGADGNVDNYGAGLAAPSVACGTVTTAAGANTRAVLASVTPVLGAVAYAWYFGVSAAAARLAAVTTCANATFIALPTGTNQLFSALAGTDNSTNPFVYDGMLTQLLKSGSGATVNSLAAGAKLTTNGAGGIAEFDAIFVTMWNLYRTGPDEMYVNLQQLLDINALVISGGGAPLFRFNMDGNSPTLNIDAGTVVGTILNPATQTKVKIIVHPNMPPGTIMFWSNSVPYPLNDIGTIVQKHLRRDYYSIEWPITKRSYDYGVYFDGVLKCYFPPAFAVLNNITQGH
jgi:hypothetical protein